MLTQAADHPVESSVFRGEALRTGERPTSRGDVALFTDSFAGMGAIAAKSLARDGYTVRLYSLVNRDGPVATSCGV